MYLYYLLFIFTLFSCISPSDMMETKNTEIIHVSDGSDSISTLELLKIIPLETNDESIFGSSYKLNIYKDKIFVHDMDLNDLYLFSGDGRYIKKIKKGKGPDEILKVYSTFNDEHTKKIYVLDADSHKIKVFNFNLDFKESIPLNEIYVWNHFAKINNEEWLVQTDWKNPPDNDTIAYYVLVNNNRPLSENKFYLPYDLDFTSILLLNPISFHQERGVLFCSVFDNNIYTLNENNEIFIKYLVDFGEYNLTRNELKLGREKITNLWKSGSRKTYLDNLYESDQMLGFTYWFKNKREFCIYSKDDKKSFSSESFKESTYVPGVFVDITDDYFVVAAEPSDVMNYIQQSDERIEKYKKLNIKEGDNPVLIYYSLKDLF